MKRKTTKPGASILVFAFLISSFLLICNGVWKTTVYLVDFTLQKQIYTQKRYITEGIMRWTCGWIISCWQELHQHLENISEVTYVLDEVPIAMEHLQDSEVRITIQKNKIDSFCVAIELLQDDKSVFNTHCKLTQRRVAQGNSQASYWIHDWYIG